MKNTLETSTRPSLTKSFMIVFHQDSEEHQKHS